MFTFRILEIGTFEGRASVFVLENLVNANCTFVDPFIEYDEMKILQDIQTFHPYMKIFYKI